jgi:hypothetical protein
MQPLSSIGLGIVFAAGCDAHALARLVRLPGWDEEEQISLGSPLSHSPEKVSAFD